MPILMRTSPRFTAEQSGGVVVIRLQRHALNSRFSRRDRRHLETLLAGHSRLVLDLNAVATINGNGVEMLADWIGCADSAGNSLVLAHCSKQVLSLMGILGVSQVARVAPSVSDAVRCFDAVKPKSLARFQGS